MQVEVKTDSHIGGSAQLKHDVEGIVQAALGRFDDRITRVEVFLSDENSRQKFGEKDKRCVIEARLGGLPPITVRHHGSSVDQAVSGAADRMRETLNRTIERKGSLLKRRAHERAELAAANARLRRDVETGQEESFKRMLRPLLEPLAQHAGRELRIMEANGTLRPGQVAVEELLDEVAVRAWLEFANRPDWMALDLWLTNILDETLEEQIDSSQRERLSLAELAEDQRPRRAPQVGDHEWWIALLGEDDTTDESDAISVSIGAEAYLEAEELMHGVYTLLGELPKLQRRTFILNVLEGYDLTEIGMLQGRAEVDVRADIAAARGYLRERLRSDDRSQAAVGEAPAASEERKGKART